MKLHLVKTEVAQTDFWCVLPLQTLLGVLPIRPQIRLSAHQILRGP